MTSLKYETIFSDFLGNVSDYQIASLNMSDAFELMTEYLHKGLKQSYLRSIFSTLMMDDEIQLLSFELEHPVEENTDTDFVVGILAKAMTIEWLKPQVRSKINISQVFGTKEMKYYAQANHLSELKGLLEDTEIELRKEIRDRGYIWNDYLSGK